MKRREFLTRSTTAAALAVSAKAAESGARGEAATSAPAPQIDAQGSDSRRLKLLFMDRRDIHNTWGTLHFGATRVQRLGDP